MKNIQILMARLVKDYGSVFVYGGLSVNVKNGRRLATEIAKSLGESTDSVIESAKVEYLRINN